MPNNIQALKERLATSVANHLPFLIQKRRTGTYVYIFVAVLMVLALGIRLLIAPVNAGLQYVTFFPAVTLAAVIGGLRPGLFATLIGLVFATFIFTPPYYSISIEVLQRSFWSNIVFLMDGIIVSYSIDAMHQYRQKFQLELEEVKESEAKVLSLNKDMSEVISELREAEKQLRIAATTFESHEAVMITDEHANIIRVNRAFEIITGYSQDEVVGKNPRILQSGRQDKNFYTAMWETILNTGTWHGEVWDRNKNGNIYPKLLTISAVKNDLGETTNYVAIFTDISERKKSEEEIHNLAFKDALTSLLNRRAFLDRLNQSVSAAARTHQYSALMFMDMDRFKTLNDTMGHDYGDLLLVEIAHRLKLCVRETDTVSRFGGDEFVVLIENIDDDENEALPKIAHIAEKIRSVLATPYQLNECLHHSSPSIGVCVYSNDNASAGELIKRADMAMYQAKESGRNRVRFFDPHMQQSIESRAALESDLQQAIAGQQLRLYYQIQVGNDGRPIGAETLIRWIHPKRGVVSPALFIPVAEESSLILEIGHWVLDTACQQLASWSHSTQTSNLTLAVNISAKQFKQPDFVEQVSAMLKKYRIDPSRLKLELTESIALDELDFVIAKMLALRNVLGVALSLDDFGTGYSSLSYLKQLPLDQIKIDQSFVRDIATDADDAIMVKTIIDMALNFRLNVIAEGVETDTQFDYLKMNGCQTYQGYLFSKPVPLEEFEKLLKQGDL